jgi:putative tricarboxylic transport membrane protein
MKTRSALAAVAALGLGAVTLTACGTGDSASADGGFDPGNQITMIVPFSAGGGSDLSGRAMAAGLEEPTGTTITVQNIEGGSGAIGYSEFLSMEGDASKLLATETALMALPATQDVQFDYTSFTPIFKAGDDYTLVVVGADSEHQTCSDVTEAAAAGDVVVGVSGATSLDEIVFSLIEADQGVEFDRIPYESGSEVLAGLLGGTIEVASLNPSEVLGQLESGDLKALCALAPERYEAEALADIPTGQEQGIDVAFAQFRGVIAPGGISDEAKAYWIKAAQAYAETEEFQAYIDENYMQAAPMYGDEFGTYMAEYDANLRKGLGL